MSKNDAAVMGFHRIKNKPHFNRFNLGRRNLFTAKIGQLLPIFCEEVLPGDEVDIDMTHFSRSMPLQTAAFTRLKENIQFFYVPYTALWSFYREAMQNMPIGQNGQDISRRASSVSDSVSLSTKLPYMYSSSLVNWLRFCAKNYKDASFNNVSGSKALRISESARLFQSLGYGDFHKYAMLMRDNEDSPTDLQFNGSSARISSSSDTTNIAISPFRLLAYHKIANDFYRYDQWQPYVAASCNVDYLNQSDPVLQIDNNDFTNWRDDGTSVDGFGSTPFLFDMEYSNLPLDRFNGGIPKSQFGDESVVQLNTQGSYRIGTSSSSVALIPASAASSSSTVSSTAVKLNNASGQPAASGTVTTNSSGFITQNGSDYIKFSNASYGTVPTSPVTKGLADSMSILALRRATALQRYKEIQECNDADFCSQIEAHFGVKPNSHGTKSKFIGGYSSVFDINPQINQNLTGDYDAKIMAAPTSNGNGHCKFKVGDDYGVIIGIYRITPQLDYANIGLDSRVLMTDASDYPIPELDSIGMDTLKVHSFDGPKYYFEGSTDTKTLNVSYAYSPRYIDWKTSFDRFDGAYLSTLKTWVTGQTADLLNDISNDSAISTAAVRLLACPPQLVDNIFVNQRHDGIDNDQFMIGSYIDCNVRRKLSVYGLPYSN